MSELPVFGVVDLEDQVSQVHAFLKSLGAPIADLSHNIETDTQELIKHCGVLGSLEAEIDAEMILNSMMTLILTLPPESNAAPVKQFCQKLVSAPEFHQCGPGKNQTKFGGALVRVLSNLFHGFGGTELQKHFQFDIYCALLKIAEKSGLVRQIPANVTTLNTWFAQWKVSIDQKRECLRILYSALLTGQQAEASNKAMLELLGTYTEADAAKARDDAAECVRTSIADSGTYLFDHLLALSPVQKLRGELIYKLLEIFVHGTLTDYKNFYQSNKSFVDKLPLNHEKNLFKIRILTLMTAGAQDQEVPIKKLADILELPYGEELEGFIIEAIQTRMIKAKIDQIRDVLVISGLQHRTFDKPQWELLRTHLDNWMVNLNKLKLHLETAQA